MTPEEALANLKAELKEERRQYLKHIAAQLPTRGLRPSPVRRRLKIFLAMAKGEDVFGPHKKSYLRKISYVWQRYYQVLRPSRHPFLGLCKRKGVNPLTVIFNR